MANGQIILIADAIVTALNVPGAAGTFGETFTAERKSLPVLKLQELGEDLNVQVVPSGSGYELLARGAASMDDIVIDVAFQKAIGGNAQEFLARAEAEVPPLVGLVSAAVDWFKANRHFTGTGNVKATLVSMDNTPIYDVAVLRAEQRFVSMIRLTLKRGT